MCMCVSAEAYTLSFQWLPDRRRSDKGGGIVHTRNHRVYHVTALFGLTYVIDQWAVLIQNVTKVYVESTIYIIFFFIYRHIKK